LELSGTTWQEGGDKYVTMGVMIYAVRHIFGYKGKGKGHSVTGHEGPELE